MKVGYHAAVQRDVNRALRRYDQVSSRLGDEFWDELNTCIKAAAANPLRFIRMLVSCTARILRGSLIIFFTGFFQIASASPLFATTSKTRNLLLSADRKPPRNAGGFTARRTLPGDEK